jgi:hypothetical protein
MKTIIKKTNGKKTVTATVLYLLFEAFKLWKPNLIDDNVERIIMLTINSGMVSGLAHKLWKNRSEMREYIKKKFKSLKRD